MDNLCDGCANFQHFIITICLRGSFGFIANNPFAYTKNNNFLYYLLLFAQNAFYLILLSYSCKQMLNPHAKFNLYKSSKNYGEKGVLRRDFSWSLNKEQTLLSLGVVPFCRCHFSCAVAKFYLGSIRQTFAKHCSNTVYWSVNNRKQELMSEACNHDNPAQTWKSGNISYSKYCPQDSNFKAIDFPFQCEL